jgi:hypothetical protein
VGSSSRKYASCAAVKRKNGRPCEGAPAGPVQEAGGHSSDEPSRLTDSL